MKTLILLAMMAIYTGRVVETSGFLPRAEMASARTDRR